MVSRRVTITTRAASFLPFVAEPLPLLEQQRADLNEIAQSRSLPAGIVFRAKLILMLAARSAVRGHAGNSASFKMDWKAWIPIILYNRQWC